MEPLVEMPDTPDLPTEGVEYDSLPENTVRQLIDRLTARVYSCVQQ